MDSKKQLAKLNQQIVDLSYAFLDLEVKLNDAAKALHSLEGSTSTLLDHCPLRSTGQHKKMAEMLTVPTRGFTVCPFCGSTWAEFTEIVKESRE